MKTLPITVDKAHIITIGEKLYTESIELIRELVNNTYDADATEVKIALTPDAIAVEDNGTGMDLEGLKQYFNIGSPEKKLHTRSPKLGRDRIGQFGIGKFATLSACDVFEVHTQCQGFAAKVTFDKKDWEKSGDSWQLPLETPPYDPERGDGTTVILSKLRKRFDPNLVEQRIVESCPIRDPQFKVYLNGMRVRARYTPGRRVPFLEGTKFGPVHGEIIILPEAKATPEELGIECKVKQVTIKREFFGMESWGKDIARIRGEVDADFLPISSSRTNFILDSEEYKAFYEVMESVKKQLGRLKEERDNRSTRRALREALHRVQDALAQNPEFAPEGILPVAFEAGGLGEAGMVKKKGKAKEETIGEKSKKEKGTRKKEEKKPMVSQLTPNAVVQRLKMGKTGITCCLDHFGPDGPECMTEGVTIFVNRDHPLYQRQVKNMKTHTMHVARLLTQEISLMKSPPDPRKAFERQSRLLKDAFAKD
ncbi:MAG: ATP-binding protein [candidate division Zixibacteria bacterium]|nr:ATP-binding protein [candidate division Zixibacteria bacterium]